MRKLLTLLAMLVLTGCKQAPELPTVISPYKTDIQQGNVVTQEMVAKLKAGMTRSQVRFALGSPLVVDPFRTDRWDYIYTYQKQGKETQRRHITVIFDDDKLLRIEGDVVPTVTATPAAADKPVATKPDAAQPEATKADVKPAVKPEAAAPEAPQADTAKTDAPAAKPEEKKDQPKEKGFFGRLRDKIGF